MLTPLIIRLLAVLPKTTSWHKYYRQRSNETMVSPYTGVEEFYLLFFCPSLGEYESIKSIIRAFRQRNESFFIEICFFSSSGYTAVDPATEHLTDAISYAPLETKRAINNYFKCRNIDFFLFSGIHIWPALIEHLINNRIPYAFAAARTRNGIPQEVYYKLMRRYLDGSTAIFCKNQKSMDQLLKMKIDSNLFLCGDPRAESIRYDLKEPPEEVALIDRFIGDEATLIFGSTHQEDETRLIPLLDELSKEWKIVIAPHNISRGSVLLNTCKNAGLFSKINGEPGGRILILDTIGHLKYTYQFGTIAYVGGGFTGELHSILEPLVSGTPVIVGFGFKSDDWTTSLVQNGGLHIIKTSQDLRKCIHEIASNPEKRANLEEVFTVAQAGINLVTTIVLEEVKSSQ